MRSNFKTFRPFVSIPVFGILAALLLSFTITGTAHAASTFNLLDARERGTTVTGAAKGTLTPTFDEGIKKDVLEFDYSIPQGAAVTVWAKNFPAELTPSAVDKAKIGIKTLVAAQASEVSVTMEVRGAQGVQLIPLSLKTGWNILEEKLDWTKVGSLKEVAFVLSPVGPAASVKGTLSFSLEFVPQAAAASSAVSPTALPVVAKTAAATTIKTATAGPVKTGTTFAPRTTTLPEEAVSAAKALAVAKTGATFAPRTVATPVAPKGSSAVKKAPVVSPVQVPAASARSSFGLLDAGDKGVLNNGSAKGVITFSFDEESKKDVYDLGYTLPEGSSMTVWTKKFPADLTGAQVNTLEFGLRALEASQLSRLAIRAELVGSSGTQTMKLCLKPGWNAIQKSIRWNEIGELQEVNFIISPKEGAGSLQGTLYLGFDFCKTTFFKKYLVVIKFGSVLILAFLLALFAALIGKIFDRNRDAARFSATSDKGPDIVSPKEASILSRLKKDLLYGAITVLILGAGIGIYVLGAREILDMSSMSWILAVGVLGALIAECLKHQFTGKHLNSDEVFQNVLVAGLLAASSSRLELLQAPTVWSNLLMINKLTATVAFLIYQIFNANAFASSGKNVKPVSSALIIGTPYMVGWLLLLENVTLLQAMTYSATLGLLAAWPALLEGVGRLLVVFVFNELLANGIGYVTKGKLLQTVKAHGFLLLVSLGVVVAPSIANLGSLSVVVGLPEILRALISVLLTVLSFGGLWGEIYLITGILLDGGKRIAPSADNIFKNVTTGMKKGMAYSGILMAILYALSMIFSAPMAQKFMASFPYVIGILAGALVFPFVKTIIETFDGSLPFFERLCYSYKSKTLFARGAVAGFGLAYLIAQGYIAKTMSDRCLLGLLIGLLASGGMSFLRDVYYAARGCGKVQSWRLYFVDSLLGIFLGSAIAFYLDSQQVAVILYKFKLYVTAHFSAAQYSAYPAFNAAGEMSYTTYPYLNNVGHYVQPVLISKWGQMDLGYTPGGVKLLFTESLDGVIKWSVATWLFAVNKVFMQAFFDKDKTPIKFFFSKAGLAQLSELMIYVLRWGLWMSPIIYTFLRMMPNPTWYNQDGAIRTLFAIYNNITMTAPAFVAWSLKMFVWILAFDAFRILIWMDHMGLRVATLVNLSFLGMDKLDEKVSKFIGKAAAQRYIPEGVKRFATWAPLLIPFYIPRGEQWDEVWSSAEKIQNAARGKGLIPFLQSLSMPQMLLLIGACILVCTGFSFVIRLLRRRSRTRSVQSFEVANREYKVVAKENGEIFSTYLAKECDVSRRAYDQVDPAGRILFFVDTVAGADGKPQVWPVTGNYPAEHFAASRIERCGDTLKVTNLSHGVKTTIEISLPDMDSPAELWKVTIENQTEKSRNLKVVPYLEWVLNKGLDDRWHTQYARLYPEMEYVAGSNAILSWQKSTKSMGFLASDVAPEGLHTGRVDFIGRGQSIWEPRALETMDFLPAQDMKAYPTFDPIGSLMINALVAPKSSATMRLMIGYSKNKKMALEMITKYLKPNPAQSAIAEKKHRALLIGHGEIPQGTPQPYYEYQNNGNTLKVLTPYTPRPFDHAMSNALHSTMVTNRGLHTSCNGNSQQNRLTPDWPDTVTKETPTEAIYLYDPDRDEWYSPTYQPLNDNNAKHESEFSVDGTAIFRMKDGSLSSQLTVFVPPEDPLGVYVLTLKNDEDKPRRMRIAPYFQMVLALQPERSGPLQMRHDKASDALYFANCRNIFRSGWAFASMSIPADCVETKRGRFFGTGRGIKRPYMVENDAPDMTQLTDDGQIAGFVGTVEIPARGECTVAVVLGQAEDHKKAVALVQKYKNLDTVRKELDATRQWWLSLMGTVKVETNQPAFDHYQNWLKYQALAERIWARRGFYQTSGAFGFRDQLQDTVNLIWVDPALARKQILLHASMQFVEGDVTHWFFTLTDGRAAFSCRSHASDNPLWLAWGTAEYVRATGDQTILDELAPYLISEFPFAPLPKNKQGWGHLYHRTTRGDTLYKHCMKSIDLVIKQRTGKNGLPLMGVGDWNDGLDEIGSEGHGESIWLGFFLYYILREMVDIIGQKEGEAKKAYYVQKMEALKVALEKTWRGDRYLRAFHDDGTEIGVKGSGVWEIDALTAAWSVMSGINFERGVTIFDTALQVLEKPNAILLGWPALREDTKPYLGRSSKYPEGVRENGMYCHGVQWLVRAARLLAEEFAKRGDEANAAKYRETAYRLWLKVSPIAHMHEIEVYGGQPNKQSADVLTNYEPGRMIWHGYTGAAGWMLRQAIEGVVGAVMVKNQVVLPKDLDKQRGALKVNNVFRDVSKSPIKAAFAG
jgi:cyclic beta-1,2-glucan synthetase